MSQLTPDQREALIAYASKQLGMDPAQLQQTLHTKNADALSEAVGTPAAEKIGALLGDPQLLERLMGSPQAKALLQQILGGA